MHFDHIYSPPPTPSTSLPHPCPFNFIFTLPFPQPKESTLGQPTPSEHGFCPGVWFHQENQLSSHQSSANSSLAWGGRDITSTNTFTLVHNLWYRCLKVSLCTVFILKLYLLSPTQCSYHYGEILCWPSPEAKGPCALQCPHSIKHERNAGNHHIPYWCLSSGVSISDTVDIDFRDIFTKLQGQRAET